MVASNSLSFLDWLAHPSVLLDGQKFGVGIVFLSLLHLCICFILLGVCASDYLCPNVSSLTRGKSGTPTKGVLTAVILAWCNSSPDLFSNFMSWTSSNAAALSVGEVLGACGFILCVVQGAIFISMSTASLDISEGQKQNVLRDLSFVVLSVLLILYMSLRNEVTLLNCIFMLALYVVYMASKIKYGYRESRALDDDDEQELTRSIVSQDLQQEADYLLKAETGAKGSMLTVLDYNHLMSMMENSPLDNDDISLKTINPPQTRDAADPPRPATDPIFTSEFTDVLQQREQQSFSSPASFKPFSDSPDLVDSVPVVERHKPIDFHDLAQKRLQRLKSGITYMFFPQLADFREKNWIGQILALALAPFTILFRLTCPPCADLFTIEDQKPSSRLSHNILLCIQGVTIPAAFMILLLSLAQLRMNWFFFIPLVLVSAAVVGAVIHLSQLVRRAQTFSLNSELSAHHSDEKRIKTYTKILSTAYMFLSIVNSILWMSVLAQALIEIIVVYQKHTGVSEGVLGLTIFSWGNSLSDLMANVAMCRLHRYVKGVDAPERTMWSSRFFFIAISACLGGVLLNSLIGIGLSGLVAMLSGASHVKKGKWWFDKSVSLGAASVDAKFCISAAAVLIQTMFLIIMFCTSSKLFELCMSKLKVFGLGMCSWWGVTTLINIFIETFGS
ncbi:LAMI_0G15610g1_1 [Lachancea mirantina]|uniref:LAMI_0G15610g1_1 n=1 Tax=Lachancea mirantina TaxID=1230905 RepID=A0A1G4KCS5_9SACH|nr:LAMI_0G15610g1_1 [Lachancea mirantina]